MTSHANSSSKTDENEISCYPTPSPTKTRGHNVCTALNTSTALNYASKKRKATSDPENQRLIAKNPRRVPPPLMERSATSRGNHRGETTHRETGEQPRRTSVSNMTYRPHDRHNHDARQHFSAATRRVPGDDAGEHSGPRPREEPSPQRARPHERPLGVAEQMTILRMGYEMARAQQMVTETFAESDRVDIERVSIHDSATPSTRVAPLAAALPLEETNTLSVPGQARKTRLEEHGDDTTKIRQDAKDVSDGRIVVRSNDADGALHPEFEGPPLGTASDNEEEEEEEQEEDDYVGSMEARQHSQGASNSMLGTRRCVQALACVTAFAVLVAVRMADVGGSEFPETSGYYLVGETGAIPTLDSVWVKLSRAFSLIGALSSQGGILNSIDIARMRVASYWSRLRIFCSNTAATASLLPQLAWSSMSRSQPSWIARVGRAGNAASLDTGTAVVVRSVFSPKMADACPLSGWN